MGFYIQGPTLGKAEHIVDNLGGTPATQEEATAAMNDSTKGVIVVVNNQGVFEAAAFAFNQKEFDDFVDPSDPRPKKFVIMDRAKAEEESGYQE